MSDINNQFIRKYQRASKSPWEDDSTILLLSDVEIDDNNQIVLSFNQYIYLHRDTAGRALGISISNKMLQLNEDFESRYLEGIEMYAFMLLYMEEITEFCNLFADEFESIFMLEPNSYFRAAEERWFNILEEA